MIVLEYMAKITELARFADDYVATDLAKVRRFEDGLCADPRAWSDSIAGSEHKPRDARPKPFIKSISLI